MFQIHYNMPSKQNQYLPTNNMRELIRDNNALLPVISRFDIAFGFGDAPIGDICRENGVDPDTFLAVCNFLSGKNVNEESISLKSLMGYLRHAHTSFLDVTLPKIRYHLIEAINRTDGNEVALLLINFFDDYVAEVQKHMDHENNEIFAYVDRLLDGQPDPNYSISRFSVNHSHMASKLNELKDIFIYHFKQKENDRLSAVLFDIIVCEHDLMSHFEVENRLFVPAVERLERTLKARESSDSDENSYDEESSPLHALGEREKDVIRCVAKGMSNKEIADELCISAHTVATHRRNVSAKLDIHSSAGLTIFAIIHHLVDLSEVWPQ